MVNASRDYGSNFSAGRAAQNRVDTVARRGVTLHALTLCSLSPHRKCRPNTNSSGRAPPAASTRCTRRVHPRRSGPIRGRPLVGAPVLRSPQVGLLGVLVALSVVLTLTAGSHVDALTGQTVNNFLNKYTLLQMATDASGFAIMGVGATIVIIAGGIDLSVGAVYAVSGVTMAMVLRAAGPMGPVADGRPGPRHLHRVSLLCGLANGIMVIGLDVHSFIITLGTMWILRGLAFVTSHAESIILPGRLTNVVRAQMGTGRGPLSGADAGHVRGHRARRRLPVAHGHGPSRLRGRRQPRSEPLCRPQRQTRHARRVRALGAVGGHRRLPWRRLLRIVDFVRCQRVRTVRDRVGRRGRRESDRAARAARSAPCWARCSSSSSDRPSARCTSTRTTNGSSSAPR